MQGGHRENPAEIVEILRLLHEAFSKLMMGKILGIASCRALPNDRAGFVLIVH